MEVTEAARSKILIVTNFYRGSTSSNSNTNSNKNKSSKPPLKPTNEKVEPTQPSKLGVMLIFDEQQNYECVKNNLNVKRYVILY